MNGAKHSILALLMMSIFMTSCNDNLMDMESSLTSTLPKKRTPSNKKSKLSLTLK